MSICCPAGRNEGPNEGNDGVPTYQTLVQSLMRPWGAHDGGVAGRPCFLTSSDMDQGETVLGSNRPNGNANLVDGKHRCSSDTNLTRRPCISLVVVYVENMRKRAKVATESERFDRRRAVVTPERSARERLVEDASAMG